MWSQIVDQEEEIRLINQKLEQIYTAVIQFPMNENYGLLTGYGSVLLFLSQYYRHTGNPNHWNSFKQKFDIYYRLFYKNEQFSFSSGIAGANWLLRYFFRKDLIETDNIDAILQDLDRVVCWFLNYHAENKNFDFLHSGIGEAYYLSTIGNHHFDKQLQSFYTLLNNAKENESKTTACWSIETYVNYSSMGAVYNMSLSHGMAAFMPCFIKYLENTDDKVVRDMLKETVNYFKSNVLPEHCSSVFPKWIEPLTNKKVESPLSWCYGDPGMAQALYQASIFLEDVEAQEIALNALLKTSNRRDIVKEHIVEACFCHGSSSLLHIFNRMYQQTHMNKFKDAALYWLRDTLTKGNDQTPYAGYSFFDNGDSNSNFSLLSGLSGVGLALLGAVTTTEPDWDECVLLS